jgi:hypothetical protein
MAERYKLLKGVSITTDISLLLVFSAKIRTGWWVGKDKKSPMGGEDHRANTLFREELF